ncbi:MAG TPA: glycosyltransferase family 39 protein [Patescibacteria group bacterium]|nr:glycosyltransferase family 39 protein [Patescibacteria group bacterium]
MHFVRSFLTQKLVLFIFILLLAGAFRLPLMQYVEFKSDEALNLLFASRFLFHHSFLPVSLTSSAGILNFPLINYLLFPIVAFTINPPTISLAIALINVLTIGGFFLLFANYQDKRTAFFASTIIALSPWAILYSRKIWEQDFLLPLSLPFFLSVYAIAYGEKKYWLLFGISSMLLMQIHQLAILLPIFIFVGLLLNKHKPQWKLFISGVLVGLIPTIPYFFYMITTDFQNLYSSTSIVARFSFHAVATFLRPLQIVSIGNFHTELGNDFALFAQQLHVFHLLSKLSYLSYVLLPISMIYVWIKQKKLRFFVVPIITIPLLYFLLGIEPLMHYFILLIPLAALCIALLLTNIFATKKLQALLLLIFILYSSGLFAMDYGFFTILAQKGGLAGDYGAGYASSKLSATAALQKFRNDKNYNELEQFYFSPIEYFHGYMPIGKIIFPYSQLQKNQQAREKQFLHSPNNPILLREVFAYYTQQKNPSWDYVVSLKEKTRIHNEFYFVYNTVLNEYLSSHFKNVYETPDFMLLYPQHWHRIAINNGVALSDNTVTVVITQILSSKDLLTVPDSYITTQTTFLSEPIIESTCMVGGAWCGIVNQPILIRGNYYQFSVTLDPKQKEASSAYALQVFKEINDSVIALK